MEGLVSPSSLSVTLSPPSSDSSPLVNPLRVLPAMHRTHWASQSFPEQQTSVLSQQQTSVLSQQQTSVLSQQQTSAASGAAWLSWRGLRQKLSKPLSFCVFELATTLLVREGRRSVSPSIDFYNNFSHPSCAQSPRRASIGLLKIRQNPSVQALFGESSATHR